MMGTFALGHWLIVIVVVAVPIWLAARILGKAGLSRWWSVLNVIPVVNFVAIWVFAYIDWPNEGAQTPPRQTTKDADFSSG